jgi:hypothetical protein
MLTMHDVLQHHIDRAAAATAPPPEPTVDAERRLRAIMAADAEVLAARAEIDARCFPDHG